VIVLAAGGGYGVYRLANPPQQALLRVLDGSGQPVTRCKLEFFGHDDSGSAPPSQPRLGELAVDGPGPVVAGERLVPGYAIVRVTAPGFGAASFLAKSGEHRENEIKLGPAVDLPGSVVDAAGKPVEGVAVEAYGSGEHGVLLAEAKSDAAGKFVVQGVARTMAYVTLRLKKDRWAQPEKVEHPLGVDKPLACKLEPTELVTGRVVVPDGVAKKGLVVQAFNLPGIATTTDEQGAFALDHVARSLEPRLIVTTLPAGFTHWLASAHPGQQVEIRVARACTVSGTVVDGRTGQIPQMAIVRHEHGPRGGESFTLDEFGRFILGNVPAGKVTIDAFSGISRREGAASAKAALELVGGEHRQDVQIRLE
jgi:hypothetical protein